MNLLDKFEKFEVKEEERISKDDQEWLSRVEKLYKRTLSVYQSVYDVFKEENESYTEEDIEEFMYSPILVRDFDIPKQISELQDKYIQSIFDHFSSKYHTSLSNTFEKDKTKDDYYSYRRSKKEGIKPLIVKEIDYHVVLDEIFEQLGGLSFEEKAVMEIKESLKEESYNKYRDEWEIKVKGKKLTYTGGYCSEYFNGHYHFNSVKWFNSLLDALSYNMYGYKVSIFIRGLKHRVTYIELDKEDFINGFTIPTVGVEHLKFFKNGRVDITFQSAEFCRNFAKDWCGYTAI